VALIKGRRAQSCPPIRARVRMPGRSDADRTRVAFMAIPEIQMSRTVSAACVHRTACACARICGPCFSVAKKWPSGDPGAGPRRGIRGAARPTLTGRERKKITQPAAALGPRWRLSRRKSTAWPSLVRRSAAARRRLWRARPRTRNCADRDCTRPARWLPRATDAIGMASTWTWTRSQSRSWRNSTGRVMRPIEPGRTRRSPVAPAGI